MQRKPGTSVESFLHHWEHRHLRETGAAELEVMPYFWYRQNHATQDEPALQLQTAGYDGWAEFYFENLEQYHEMRGSPRVRRSKDDEQAFQAAQPLFYATTDTVLLDGDGSMATHKLLRLFKRRFDVRTDEFRDRWADEHGPRAIAAAPQAIRYVQAAVVEAAYVDAQPLWDGFDILWLAGDVDAGIVPGLTEGLDKLLDVVPPPAIVAREVVPAFMETIFAASIPEAFRKA